MAVATADVPEPEPQASSGRWIVILVVAVALAVVVTQLLWPLFVLLVPRGQGPARRIEDTLDLRTIVGFTFGAETPLAPDGRIDVYAMLKQQGLARQQILDLCHGSRAGKGPTWEEIEAGDYRNFPYQRHRGARDRRALVAVPLVWDREPENGERLAGFSDGSAGSWSEAKMQEFFRGNPGQE
jgi:hypothetical protein